MVGEDMAILFGAAWLLFLLFALAILAVVFWIMMLINCATMPDKKIKKYGGKVAWILILVFLGLLGAIIYYFVVKRKAK